MPKPMVRSTDYIDPPNLFAMHCQRLGWTGNSNIIHFIPTMEAKPERLLLMKTGNKVERAQWNDKTFVFHQSERSIMRESAHE